MRRIILLITALLVTFGVFANGSKTATAPSLASVFGHFDSSAVKETAVKYPMPRRAAAAVPKTAEQPAVPEAAAEPVYLETELQMTEIDTIDLGSGIEITPSAPEYDGTFDKDGWVTLSYGTPEQPAAASIEIAAKNGSRAMSAAVFSSRIVEKPMQVHSASGRNSAGREGERSLFEPVTARLRVETADGRTPAIKLDRKMGLRTVAKQRDTAIAHAIVFTETAEPVTETRLDAVAETVKASVRPAFIPFSFQIEPEKPSPLPKTAAFVPTFAQAPTVLQFVSAMGSAISYNDTPSVARFLEATAGAPVFTADIPAPPARLIEARPASDHSRSKVFGIA
jgi:hypothetical protein